jgi:membrane protein YdbS with pleckstrin-like domain
MSAAPRPPSPPDPFALYLNAPPPSAPEPPAPEPVPDELEAMRTRLRRALEASPVAAVPPPVHGPSPPPGAILAAHGGPFTDPDAARFKAALMAAESGGDVEVVEVAGGYALIPHAAPTPVAPDGARSRTRSRPPPSSDSAPLPKAARPRGRSLLDPEGLTLDDFPKDHPIHHYGAAGLRRYQRMLNKNFKLKQAFRSQLPLLSGAALGGLVVLVPDAAVHVLFSPKALATLPSFLTADHLARAMVAVGALFALFCLGKVVWVRLYYRYLLLPNYAKTEAGIVALTQKKMVYTSVITTDLHQSVLGRLLNYGSVELSCAAGDHSDLMFRNVYGPALVQALVETRAQDARRRQAIDLQDY